MSDTRFALAALGVLALLSAGCDRAGEGEPGAQAGAAGSETAAAPIQAPPEVAEWIETVRAECEDAGGRFEGVSDYLLPADFNGDGQTDYVLQWGGVSCPHPDGRASGALGWGNAGPRNEFLISEPGGSYRRHDGFSSELSQDAIRRRGDRDVIVNEGTWFQPGGEVHQVIWGWTGQEIDVIERLDAQGRQVDENGYLIQAGGSGGAEGLPFREGSYGRGERQLLPATGEYSYPTTRYISADRFGYDCRVVDRSVSRNSAILTVTCPDDCSDGICTAVPRFTVSVTALDGNRVSIRHSGYGEYMDGEYTYIGPNFGD